jgi:kinetochore protein Spc24, fungi type
VRPVSVLSAEAHTAFLNEHDVTRLQLAKAIHETEGLQAKQEAELTTLKEEARTLEDSDPALEHQQALQGTA